MTGNNNSEARIEQAVLVLCKKAAREEDESADPSHMYLVVGE
jgi:hypothetical protein